MTVLICDDEKWCRTSLIGMINWDTFGLTKVGEAVDCLDALKKATALSPDIILTDLRMPGMTPDTYLLNLFRSSPHSRIIIISGYSDFEWARKGIEIGADNYLLKPISLFQLETALYKSIEKRNIKISKDKEHRALKRSVSKISASVSLSSDVSDSSDSSDAGSLADAIIRYVKDHFCEDIRLQNISDYFAISPKYVSTLVKKKSGLTFTELLKKQRVDYAVILLGEKKMSVSDTARLCGYSDVRYFRKIFKSLMGRTPGEFKT